MSVAQPILPLSSLDTLGHDDALIRLEGSDQINLEPGPIDLILEIIEAGEKGLPPIQAAVSLLKTGFFKYLTGEEKDLSIALGVPKTDRQTHRRAMQQHYLRQAWDLLHCDQPGRTARATALEDEIARLEQRWVEFEALDHPDPSWHRLRKTLWRARKFGTLPKKRQLLRIF